MTLALITAQLITLTALIITTTRLNDRIKTTEDGLDAAYLVIAAIIKTHTTNHELDAANLAEIDRIEKILGEEQ